MFHAVAMQHYDAAVAPFPRGGELELVLALQGQPAVAVASHPGTHQGHGVVQQLDTQLPAVAGGGPAREFLGGHAGPEIPAEQCQQENPQEIAERIIHVRRLVMIGVQE